MIGAHTDSPCLRIKPVSKRQADGYLQVGVEKYGGGLWHTWFDRDLSIAGRVVIRTEDGNFETRLVKVERPILRIPTLAIHLDRQEKFEFNTETQLYPIAGLVAAELNRQGKTEDKDVTEKLEDAKVEEKEFNPLKVASDRHHPYIVEIIAEEAGCAADKIVDFEMLLYDTHKSCFGGLNNELIFSARLDNLMMSFCALQGLIQSVHSSNLKDDHTIRLIALFDNEEIGSLTAQGADSNLLPAITKRLSSIPTSTSLASGNGKDRSSESSYEAIDHDNASAHEQTLIRSFLISADMAHSVHPNYGHKYEAQHRPAMNGGPVIKINANARYASNSPGIVLLEECARRAVPPPPPPGAEARAAGVPLQLFVVRNDSTCGGTIGPMLAAALGARTIDMGNAQLSMHSIRETTGAFDAGNAIALFESFFEHYGELEAKIVVD